MTRLPQVGYWPPGLYCDASAQEGLYCDRQECLSYGEPAYSQQARGEKRENFPEPTES